MKLTATAKDKNGTVLSVPVTWSVPPFSIVSVDQTGLVKSLGSTGSASVNASVQSSGGAISTVVTVTVTAAPLAAGSLYFGAVRSAFPGGPANREINVINPNTLVESDLTANPADDDFPVVSPDGQYIWFFTYRFVQRGEYVIMKKDGTGVTRLFTGCQLNDGGALFNYCVHPTAWLPDSRLVYTISDESLPSLNIILISNVLTPSTGAVTLFTGAGSSAFSNFSPSGTLGFNLSGNGLLQVIRMSDGVTTTLAPACTFTTACTLAAWAASEKSIFAFREGALYEFPVDGSASRKMYTASGTPSELAVSPDGLQIAFIESGSLNIIATTGSAAPKTLASSTGQIAWSPDGKSVAFSASQFDNGIPDQIWGINVTGTGKKKITDITFLRGLSWGK